MGADVRTIGVIPARMESSRFPGKPLAKILGLEMVVHCFKRAKLSSSLDDVVVATCNQEIVDAVESHGGRAVMTANTHERCTDRVYEAVQNLKLNVQNIVIIQGDEPMVTPEMIDQSIGPILSGAKVSCTNLVAKIEDDEEFLSPNTIKVALDRHGNALYMSRAPIPYGKMFPQDTSARWKQVCVMSFTQESLKEFCNLSIAPLEKLESIDMNRYLWHGRKVFCVPTEFLSCAVDTPADLERVESLMKNDALVRRYM